MSGLIEELEYRGFIYQATNLEKLKEITANEHIVAYIGFDPTAESLHVGNLMQIMLLRLLQKHGHKPIALVGGATTKVGDPSGKDEARAMLSDEQLEKNLTGIKKCLSKFFKFGVERSDAIMLNNNDWLGRLSYIDFLREYGPHFSVNRMLTMDSVKLRLEREQNLSFLEFNYMLLQAYDFLHLSREHDCKLQMGGSDQWGNIIQGVELTRRVTGEEVFGLTTPLLTTSSGSKMGKSVNGAVWIDEDKLSPYEYYQFWRNVEDNDVVRFAKLYTDMERGQIEELANLAATQINEAKKSLAFEVTKLCHGEQAAHEAAETAKKVFEQGGAGDALPTYEVERAELRQGIAIYALLASCGLCSSNSEARKLIRGNGAKMNNVPIEDENLIITSGNFIDETLKLSAGKKRHVLIKAI